MAHPLETWNPIAKTILLFSDFSVAIELLLVYRTQKYKQSHKIHPLTGEPNKTSVESNERKSKIKKNKFHLNQTLIFTLKNVSRKLSQKTNLGAISVPDPKPIRVD